ncbi:MAG: restriction endonuclease subunit S [Acidobacteria bacterium]|nr:restriction endonuclease subunit S [Acidobacteriota bacterium]
MAGEWTERLLGDVIDIKHGFAFKGEFFRDEAPGDILLTPGNFAIGGGFKAEKLKYYDGPVPDEFVLSDGDLLVTMTDLSKNADTLGYPAFVPRSGEGLRYLHNQRLGKVAPKHEDAVHLRYLHYLMCSQEYRHEVVASATGTTVKHTSPERIKRFRFRLPPPVEQRAIAHILGTLDDKIELNRRMNDTLEAMARALFKSWFVDFDPVRAKTEGRNPGLPRDVADLFPRRLVDSELGEIPAGWEVKSLDEAARFLNGLALQKYPPEGERWLPVIKIAQLRAGHTIGADRASLNLEPDYIVEDGDVLFSWSGSLECVLWAGGQGALNQHLFKVTSDKYPKWLCYLSVHLHLDDFRHIAAGKATTMGHIQRHHLASAKLPIPCQPELLRAMDRAISPIIESTWRRAVHSRTLAALRDTLLPKLISGELRVKDAEEFIGRVV